jgi:hypothetical protein
MKGWKTLLFSALVAVLGVLQTADLADILGDNAGPALVIIGAISAALRMVTTGPAVVGKSE